MPKFWKNGCANLSDFWITSRCRARNVGQTSGRRRASWWWWKLEKITPKIILEQMWAKILKKRDRSCDAKNLRKLDFQNTQKLKMWGVNFGEIFGPEKDKDPNFGMAELHFRAPSPHVFMTGESGLKASSIKPHVCPLKNIRTGWMFSCVWARWGTWFKRCLLPSQMYLFCPLWCNGRVFSCLSSCQVICYVSLKTS